MTTCRLNTLRVELQADAVPGGVARHYYIAKERRWNVHRYYTKSERVPVHYLSSDTPAAQHLDLGLDGVYLRAAKRLPARTFKVSRNRTTSIDEADHGVGAILARCELKMKQRDAECRNRRSNNDRDMPPERGVQSVKIDWLVTDFELRFRWERNCP